MDDSSGTCRGNLRASQSLSSSSPSIMRAESPTRRRKNPLAEMTAASDTETAARRDHENATKKITSAAKKEGRNHRRHE
eukprot:267460-Prymnesium_polylepis.1